MTKKPEERLRQYLSELEKLNAERRKLLKKISATKTLLVDSRNYVGIVYNIRFLDYVDRDLLFTEFLYRHPEDFLFVMAFANTESSSYYEAEEIAETAYEENIYAIMDEVKKERDRILCLFLDQYDSEVENLQYVYDIIDELGLNEYSWMESYKRVVSRMVDLL